MKKMSLIVTLSVIGVFALFAAALYSNFNSIQKDMIAKETALGAQYQDNQNELSTYVVTIKETMGVADKNTEALDTVISNAIKGRYEDGGAATNGEMFSAMTEAYPELGEISTSYENVQAAISSGREAHKNKQSKLLDMLRDYDTWRSSGLIKSQMVKMMGAPSDNLVARIGEQSWRGQEALDKMHQIVLVQDAKESYQSGELEPLEF